jgi:hypothetical protein
MCGVSYWRMALENSWKFRVELICEKLFEPGMPRAAASALSFWLAVYAGKIGYSAGSDHNRSASRYFGSSVGTRPVAYGM